LNGQVDASRIALKRLKQSAAFDEIVIFQLQSQIQNFDYFFSYKNKICQMCIVKGGTVTKGLACLSSR
jgi:hypothetical protein